MSQNLNNMIIQLVMIITIFHNSKNVEQTTRLLYSSFEYFSISAHINDFRVFLNLANNIFDIMCISKSRVSAKHPQTTNIDLPEETGSNN